MNPWNIQIQRDGVDTGRLKNIKSLEAVFGYENVILVFEKKAQRFPRSEIVTVDLVKFDTAKAARTASFWTYGVIVLTLLVGERS